MLGLTRRVQKRTRIAITGDGPGSLRGSGVIFGGSAPPPHSNQGLSGTRPSAYSFPHSLLSLFSHACARTSTRYLAWVHATFLRNGPDTEVSWQRTGTEVSWQRTGTEVACQRLEPPIPAIRLQAQASVARRHGARTPGTTRWRQWDRADGAAHETARRSASAFRACTVQGTAYPQAQASQRCDLRSRASRPPRAARSPWYRPTQPRPAARRDRLGLRAPHRCRCRQWQAGPLRYLLRCVLRQASRLPSQPAPLS